MGCLGETQHVQAFLLPEVPRALDRIGHVTPGMTNLRA